MVSSFPCATFTPAVSCSPCGPGKRVKSSKKYRAHDEENKAKVGDKVRIVETRPLSKTKRYVLVEIVEEAIIL